MHQIVGGRNLQRGVLVLVALVGALVLSVSTGRAVFADQTINQCVIASPPFTTNCPGANLFGANLSYANLSGANLSRASLDSADLHNATLRGANLTFALLFLTNLTSANLDSADLRGARMDGADLRNANLQNANLRDAIYLSSGNTTGVLWRNTTCPDGTNSNNNGNTCAGHLTGRRDGGITLSSSPNPANLDQLVIFIAKAGCYYTPETVTFLDGTTAIGTGTIDATGQATFSTSRLAAGQHSITASYPGNATCLPAISAAVLQLVNSTPKLGNGVLLTASANPTAYGQPVTFAASLDCSGYPPAGTAIFYDGSTPLGKTLINSDRPTYLTVKTLTAGAHTIRVVVSGTGCGTLTSAPLSQSVR